MMLCAASEQCTPELRAKLAKWEINATDADRIMRRLVKERFVDDRRFARAYALDKMRFSGWGRYKIMSGMIAKRLPREVISHGIEAIDPGEYARKAEAVMRAKARGIREGNTYEGRTRLFRFAASRGFETDLAARIIRSKNLWEDEIF